MKADERGPVCSEVIQNSSDVLFIVSNSGGSSVLKLGDCESIHRSVNIKGHENQYPLPLQDSGFGFKS